MKRLLLFVGLILALIGVMAIPTVTKQTPKSDGIPLEPPIFVAKAVEIKAIKAFPKDRAGFSAYVRVDGSKIDLQKVATVLNQIEDVGDNYLVGYFKWRYWYTNDGGIPPDSDFYWGCANYDTYFFKIHVYVDKDGWIIAYVDRDDPTALAILPTKNTTLLSENETINFNTGEGLTLLEAIKLVCNATGIDYNSIKDQIKYYDFEHPTANRVALFWKEFTNENDALHFKVPDGSTVYEASWIFLRFWDSNSISSSKYAEQFKLDDQYNYGNATKYVRGDYWGFFNETYISTNAHSIRVFTTEDYNHRGITGIVGVAIIYEE